MSDLLYYDIICSILVYVDPVDTFNVRLVSKMFNDILNENSFWKLHFYRDYGIKHKCTNKLPAQNYKDKYKKCIDICVFKQKMNHIHGYMGDKQRTIYSFFYYVNFGSIDNIINMFQFDLLDKNIEEIPREIGSLINLEILNMNKNKITEIPILRKDL
jgi:Leucine-rich repeat (LRR) protein